jgi:hypothetical protein
MSKSKRHELLDTLDQLARINRARNDILHHGTDRIDPKKIVVSNRRKAKSDKHIREFEISPEALDAMFSDVLRILAVLHVHSLAARAERAYRTAAGGPLDRAWQYVPPAIIARDQKAVEAIQRRRRRPEPALV